MLKVLAVTFSPILVKLFAIAAIPLLVPGSEYLFWIFIVALFIPEMAFLLSPKFRKWLKDGVEDGDGVLNKSDLISLLNHYATAWCIRLYVLFGLVEVFYGVQVREIIATGTLAGAFGIEAMIILRGIKK